MIPLAAFAMLPLLCRAADAQAAPGATPPPTPPPIASPAAAAPAATAAPAAVASPIPLPSGFTLPGSPSGKPGAPTPPPPKPTRKGIEGVWEVQIQRGAQTTYTHFHIKHQSDNVLTGNYRNQAGKVFPLSGSIQGQNVRMVVSMPNGTTLLLQSRLDGTSDMVGTLTSPKGEVYFTASWRPKEKFINNITPAAGGLGGNGLPNGGPP